MDDLADYDRQPPPSRRGVSAESNFQSLGQFPSKPLGWAARMAGSVASEATMGSTDGPSLAASDPSSDPSSELDDLSDTRSLLSDLSSVRGGDPTHMRKQFQRAMTTLKQKAAAKINSLKTEIAILQDSLERARMTDITFLENNLRESRNDMIALRQRNTELRDYIREMEGRMFEALSELEVYRAKFGSGKVNADADVDNDNFYDAGSGDEPRNVIPFSNNSSNNGNAIADQSAMIRSLERRCKELEETLSEYAEKLSAYKYKLKTPDKRRADLRKVNSAEKDPALSKSEIGDAISRLQFDEKSDSVSESSHNEVISFDSILHHLNTEQRRFLKTFIRLSNEQVGEEKDKTIRQLADDIKQLTTENKKIKEAANEAQMLAEKKLSANNSNQAPVVRKSDVAIVKKDDSAPNSYFSFFLVFLLGALFAIVASSLFQWRDIFIVVFQFLKQAYEDYKKKP